MRSAKFGRIRTAKALIKEGTEVNFTSKGGATSLMIAFKRGEGASWNLLNCWYNMRLL